MKRKLLSILLCLAMALSLLPTAALAEGTGATENYVTLELTYGSNVTAEQVAAAKAMYEGKKYETCKAANEAFMALYGVSWRERGGGNPYLDVTDSTAPLRAYASNADAVTEVKYYIHGTLAGFTSLQSDGNNIDCTVGGNHQIPRTSISIIGVDGSDGSKAKLTNGNIQAYVAGGYDGMFRSSGKLTIYNIEFTSTTSTTVGASAAVDANATQTVTSAEMEIKNCKFNGRLYVYDNFANTGMKYNIHDNVFNGTNYSGDSNAYSIFAQCRGGNELIIKNNNISGFARGINIDHANVKATIEGNTISITDPGRACIQLSSLITADIKGNTLNLNGGNAITLHEKLLGMTTAPEVSITGNTITGNGYLIYDDAAANNKSFTSENLKLTYSANTVADTVNTTKGVKDSTEYGVSDAVKAATISVAEVAGKTYPTLQAAVDAAGRNATVKLLANTRENVTISTRDLTLDLNGFTLNGGTVAGKPALTVTARMTVIKDGSTAQTGTIMREDTAENSGISSHYVIDIQGNGWLTFEGGNVKNNSGIVGATGASLVRVGDDSVAQYPGLTIKGGTFTQDNFIVIKVDRGNLFLNGGTLNSANTYAVENWFRATIKGGTVNGAVSSWTYSSGSNSTLTISGGTINGDVTSVNYGNAEGKKATVAITGGTINGELDTRSYDPKTNELTSINDAAKATIEVTGGTFSSDPTKYLVEGSTATKNENGTFGVAKAYLAKVGNTSYYTMDEAFKAQTTSGAEIVLLRDYTTGSPFSSGSIDRVVNLNDHKWTCTGTDANSAAFEINHPGVTLTVKNGKIVSSQLVGLIPSAMGGTITYDNSSLTFENVEMSTTATSGIETNGNNTNDSVTLKNSTLNVPNGFGIYFPSSGTLTIDNSTINAKTMGVQVCAGSLNINEGSAITVSGDAVPKTEGDGAIQDGAAISIVNRTGYKGLGDIAVTGGTFTAKDTNAAIKAYNWENKTESDFNASDKVSVSGGTFSSIPDNMNALCAAGYIPFKNADGAYGVTRPSSGSSGSYDPTYSVSTPSKTENGSVTVSPKSASKGDTVTVTVKPDSGYVLETLTVTDKNGNELTLKDKGNGKYTFTMPAGKVEVKATFMEDNSMLNFFYDVPNDAYFYEAVKWAVKNGITTGVGNDLFAPEQPCTRAQIVTFLWRAAGSPEPKGAASGMTDVVSGSYYEKAVAWAIENGITTGTTTSTFSPDATCTRAQAVTFLARALNAKAASAAEFSDVPTDSYFADAVAWAAANGVTEGIGGGLFGSDNDCTRGQIVTFLYRAYNK